MALENLKVSDDRSQELAKKMKEVKVLDEATSVETVDLAKNAIKSLDNAKLATFIETQFKSGDAWKLFVELTADPMYVFTVQSTLDALGYDALLTGGDTTFGIDEVYGSRTKVAVTKFQEDAWLTKKDGLVGEETFAALVGKLKDPTFKPQLPVSVPTDAAVDQTTVVRDAQGKITVDAYGNAVNYVTSIDDIPVADFNAATWWKHIYVINGYTVYGNGRVMENKTRKIYNWEDVKDAISSTVKQPSVIDIEPFGKETFDDMVDVIQKDIVNKLGKDAQWYFVSLVDKEDPSVSIKIFKYPYNKSFPVNLNSYQNDSWLDAGKLKNDVVAIIASAKEEVDKKNERDKKIDTWLSSVRWSTYTIDKLFPDLKWKKMQQYKTFFSKFDSSAIKIDESLSNTKLSLDKKNIVFDLDQSGYWDDEHVQNITIPVEEIFDAEGNPKTPAEQLKVLAKAVGNIIENSKNGYVA